MKESRCEACKGHFLVLLMSLYVLGRYKLERTAMKLKAKYEFCVKSVYSFYAFISFIFSYLWSFHMILGFQNILQPQNI